MKGMHNNFTDFSLYGIFGDLSMTLKSKPSFID